MRGINRQGELFTLIGKDDQVLGPGMDRRMIGMFDDMPIPTGKRDLHGKVFG